MDKATVKTRLLIISDTHGMDLDLADIPFQRADIAIHCGDLTEGSKLNEFRTTIKILKDIDAPLKLASLKLSRATTIPSLFTILQFRPRLT